MASRSLDDLHPDLKPVAEEFALRAKSEGVDFIFTCTYRDETEQAQLYAQGRTMPGKIVTRAKPGQSAHNFMLNGKPAARAFDVVPMENGKPIWSDKATQWQTLGRIGMGLGLNWYGNPGCKFREMPHFQLKE